MRSPDNQIIWGRRGTGKTHLFRAFTQRINDDTGINEVAYYITCNDVKYEAPNDKQLTDDMQRMKEYAFETYKNFMVNLIDQLINTYEELLKKKKNKDIANKVNFKEVEDNLARLLEICTIGIPTKVRILGKERSGRANKNIKEREVGIHIRPQINKPLYFLMNAFHVKFKRIKEDKIYNTTNTETEIEYVISLGEIRKAVKELLTSMRINILYICIDELCLIDDKYVISIQPIFLNYLSQTFFGLNKICVKIASIREMTRLNSKNSLNNCYGIQSGHDIFELADLDLLHVNDDKLVKKFEDIVTTRFTYFSKVYNSKTFVYETDFIIKNIFKNKRYFNALISLSHGVPRNFLHILQVCLASIDFDIAHYFIHVNLISEVVMSIYVNDRRSNMLMNNDSVYFMISNYVKKKKEFFFLISTEQAKRMNVEISNLVYTEIIHRIPSSLTPTAIMDTYDAFFVDAGKYLHILKEFNKSEFENRLDGFLLDLPKDIKDNYYDYVIDLDNVKTDGMECPNCGTNISKENPVYRMHNCCHVCGFQLGMQKSS